MPYTSQGYMTAADISDWEESTDNGSVTLDMAYPPDWFNGDGTCPLDHLPYSEHEWVTVSRASGEPWDCDITQGKPYEESFP